MTTQQQYVAAIIQAALTLALLAAMFAPAQRFGFVVGTVGKGTVVGVFAVLSACWLVYAQRYRPEVDV